MTKRLDEALSQLKRDPAYPVRANVEGMTVEVRVVGATRPGDSAAEPFALVGPWAGETTDEILAILAEARRKRSHREVSGL
jgi:hypothetical protein